MSDTNLYRAQILLEPRQHRALAKAAEQQNRSVSELVREILNAWMEEHALEVRKQQDLETLDSLRQMRLHLQEKQGVYQGDLLNEIREEREQENDAVWGSNE
jgi:hypothetical protein